MAEKTEIQKPQGAKIVRALHKMGEIKALKPLVEGIRHPKKIMHAAVLATALVASSLGTLPARADLFDGKRLPSQFSYQLDFYSLYSENKPPTFVFAPKWFGEHAFVFASLPVTSGKVGTVSAGAGRFFTIPGRNLSFLPLISVQRSPQGDLNASASFAANYCKDTNEVSAKAAMDLKTHKASGAVTLAHQLGKVRLGLEIPIGAGTPHPTLLARYSVSEHMFAQAYASQHTGGLRIGVVF